DEGLERVVEDLVHACAPWLATGSVLLDLDVCNLRCPHDIPDANGVGGTCEPHPAVPSAHCLDQARAGQQGDDLEHVLRRDLQTVRKLRHLDEAGVRPGAIDQDTYGVAGGFGQTHRYRCLERAWIGSTYCMTGLQKRGCGIGHVNLTGGNWGVGSARGRLVLL